MIPLTRLDGYPDSHAHYVDAAGVVYTAYGQGFPEDSYGHLICRCGNDRFVVRHAPHYETIATCPACRHEAVIHSG